MYNLSIVAITYCDWFLHEEIQGSYFYKTLSTVLVFLRCFLRCGSLYFINHLHISGWQCFRSEIINDMERPDIVP